MIGPRSTTAVAEDGTRLYVEELGHGSPLLLIPGQSQDHRVWDSIRGDFAAQHRVVVFDPRGTGRSDKPRQPSYSMRRFVDDALAVLDHLGIARSHVYGISMGGRVAQWLAIDCAERVAVLVLGGTSPGNAHGIARAPDVDALMRSYSTTPGYPDEMLELMASRPWLLASPGVLEHALAAGDATPDYVRQQHYLASEAHDSWDRLPEIASPTLVIHGDQDRVNVCQNAQLLAARIPGARLQLIAGGRHLYFLEFRQEASAMVLHWLRACA